MSLFKRISLKVLVIAILAVKCVVAQNHINYNLLLCNSTEMDTEKDKLNALEGKFNAFVTTISTNMSTLLHRVEEREYAENMTMQIKETNTKLDALTTLVRDIKITLWKPLTSCEDAFANPLSHRGNGIYNIQLNNSSPFAVYCMADPNGGLPWTVVQRRVDGTVNFYRNWAEYKRGFGDLHGNFFIGLDKLHSFTTQGEPQELWVKLTDPDGKTAHAYYDLFAIGSESEEYALKVLGKYSGDAFDSLSFHRGVKFSTMDHDSSENCAQKYQGAWWYKDCHRSHLNGLYGSTSFGQGVNWDNYRGPYVSMTYTHMAIRPTRKY